MRYYFINLSVLLCLFTGCSTSGVLSVNSVNYQALRTEFAQSESIPKDAKIAVEYFFNSEGEMQPVVYNLTSEILILDQTKSFVIMPDGMSVSYYDPAVHTSTTGTYSSETGSKSFNLGGITAALGIGGPLSILAGATTLGSSATVGAMSQNSITITDQPKVNIGPKGCIAMSKAYQIPGIGKNGKAIEDFVDIPYKKANTRFSVCITYSVDDGESFDKLVTNFYLSSSISIPVKNRMVSQAFYSIYNRKPDALAENTYLFIIPNNIKSETTNMVGDFLTHTNVYDSYIQGSLTDFQ